MMRRYLPMIFSLFFLSSIIFVSTIENSFADEIVATGTGFENSTILELKNIRGNVESINSVRIWLSGDNEFKTFKTEQGWIGKNTPQGVIVFTSQESLSPGESVKFGIKTTENNPVINWKALNSNGEVVSSASTRITNSEQIENKSEFNEPKVVGVNENSSFRLIPEKPGANSDFRVIGENFVPNESLDFYIGKNLEKEILVNEDGRILFTSKVPDVINEERTEFILRDSEGNEKTISIRISDSENRVIPDLIKLSLGNTPKEVKRGEVIPLVGMATPNTTLTITVTHENDQILNINTIDSGFDGKWTYENLFMPDMELGSVSIEITDGMNKALRNFNVISSKIIDIKSEVTMYEVGTTISFFGNAIPNKDMSIIVEDSIGTEIFSKTIKVGETGDVEFDVDIPRGSVEGTYVLTGYQDEEEGITIFGIGQEPEEIIIAKATKLNFSTNENVKISIQGPTNAQVSIIIIDSADREKISDTINLGPDGREIYEISTDDLPTGSFTFNVKRGESSSSEVFTIGLTTGSGTIEVQSTRGEYKPGEQMLILGNTGAINVLLDVTISDPNGKIIKKVETFSDKSGLFKIDNFRIPSDAITGEWSINAKSGGNFKDAKFMVVGTDNVLTIIIDKSEYRVDELMNITGNGARMSATVTLNIVDSGDNEIAELNITAKSNGEFLTIWRVPVNLNSGEYTINADDGIENTSIKFTIN